MKAKFQLLFIVVVIMLILIGEAAYAPLGSSGVTVVIKTYPSTSALVQALSNGEVDIATLGSVAPQILSQLKNDPNLNIVPIGNFGFTYIGLNLRTSPLNNSVFREAMLYGFNRERVLNDALRGYGETLSPGFFSSAYAALGWRNDSVYSFPYDPEKASRLLDSIGFVQSSTGVRVDPSTGQQLNNMYIVSKLSDPQAVAAANSFAEDMNAIGIPVISFPQTDFDFDTIKVNYSFNFFIDTETAGPAPMWLYDLFAGVNNVYPAPLSTNLVGYDNSTFNQYANQLMTASNSDTARVAALKCQEELSLDLPAFPVYSPNLLLVEQKGSLNITPIAGSIPSTLAASLANMTSGRLVRIGEVGGLADINPAIDLGAADSLALRLITTPLLTSAPDGSPQPGLVTRWQSSDNATTLTLNLNQDLVFQDGSTTTAHDLGATLNWLRTNALSSSPLYQILKTIRDVAEVDPHTVRIDLAQSNYFAAYEIANLFALPSNLLPQTNGPLALLLSGALQSSGPFELALFVQSAEVDLESTAPVGRNPRLMGAQAADVFGSSVGGSIIRVNSQPLTYGGQTIENATFTVLIRDGNSTTQIPGAFVGLGLYQASLDLNRESLSLGDHAVTTQLYGQLPTGVIIQFNQERLLVHPPLLVGQIILCLLAVAAVGLVAYYSAQRKRRMVKRRRVRPLRRTTARRQRRRT